MNGWIKASVVVMMAAFAPACAQMEPGDEGDDFADSVLDGDDGAGDENEADVGEAEQALCYGNLVYHYTYSDSTGNYRWDVTHNTVTGKRYVDERRIGGGFYQQYVLTPYWAVCWGEEYLLGNISIKAGGVTQTGPHNCLPGPAAQEEVHLNKQRLLSRRSYDFVTCEPIN